jgi:hypothetical protein
MTYTKLDNTCGTCRLWVATNGAAFRDLDGTVSHAGACTTFIFWYIGDGKDRAEAQRRSDHEACKKYKPLVQCTCKPEKEKPAPKADPRQVDLTEILEGNSGHKDTRQD